MESASAQNLYLSFEKKCEIHLLDQYIILLILSKDQLILNVIFLNMLFEQIGNVFCAVLISPTIDSSFVCLVHSITLTDSASMIFYSGHEQQHY